MDHILYLNSLPRLLSFIPPKNEGQEGKIILFLEWVPMWGDGHKERGNEGICGGCVLYTYMKIKE
jgi:hypothetical protein